MTEAKRNNTTSQPDVQRLTEVPSSCLALLVTHAGGGRDDEAKESRGTFSYRKSNVMKMEDKQS